MTSAQKPGALPVVAYCYYGGERENFPSGPHASLLRSVAFTFERQPHYRNETPLVRLSDAQASLLAKEAECEALRVIKQAISDYHYALDTRQHGGVAQDRAFAEICTALDLHWVLGDEKERRAAIASTTRAVATQEINP